ncbi:MAG TPA: PfkB family carbohydrate kinase, partial [Micavibrio sp.]
NETLLLGGAASVVANIGGLGVASRVLGICADDRAGAQMRALLQQAGADTRGVLNVHDRPTTVKMRFVTGADQTLLLRTDYESAAPLQQGDEAQLLAAIAPALQGCGAVILSDYGKGVLSDAVMQAVMTQANALDIPVLVDPKGKDYRRYAGARALTPNAKELGEGTQMPTATEEEVIKAARHLIDTTGIPAIIAKRSEHGMIVVTPEALPLALPATAPKVLGVAGAGDTVIATLAVGLSAGLSLPEAATLANQAAGVIVAKPGTTPITRAELLAALSPLSPIPAATPLNSPREAPIFHDAAAARLQIEQWKAAGLKIGFTNGCFDILHYGHVNYLNRAREKCDRLVVGLNADASITRLKGPDRPVHEELSRAAVLAALACVDMVVFFGDDAADSDMPLRLIETLKPDICFKGGDYRASDLPEAKIVAAYGGAFEIMPLYQGHSTSAAIDKIRESA